MDRERFRTHHRMSPIQVTLELTPKARLDVIDARARAFEIEPALLGFSRCLYSSYHTTAGYLEQSLASRLTRHRPGIQSYLAVFRTCFPERAGYRHDRLEERIELTTEQRQAEPMNADSHLAFIAAGLRTCVSYRNHRGGPVCFIDLDGVHGGVARRRRTTVLGYNAEMEVARLRVTVPMSHHPVDSVNLKESRLGIYQQIADLVTRYGVDKGRVRLQLAPDEVHAGVTVNEYETLLMKYDLAEVLRDPLRFVAEKGRHILAHPRAIPGKTLDYAKYDLVRTLNQLFDALGLHESLVERVMSRALAVPAARFLRMKRSVSLLVSDADGDGRGTIVEGPYQSPILVQWRGAGRRQRALDISLTRFV